MMMMIKEREKERETDRKFIPTGIENGMTPDFLAAKY